MGSERCAEPEAGRKSIMFSGREEKEMRERRCTAIVLAGGQGKRMGTKTSKQYLDILGKPVYIIPCMRLNSRKLLMTLFWL